MSEKLDVSVALNAASTVVGLVAAQEQRPALSFFALAVSVVALAALVAIYRRMPKC